MRNRGECFLVQFGPTQELETKPASLGTIDRTGPLVQSGLVSMGPITYC